MGNKQSDKGARDFFYGVGGVFEKGGNAISSTLGAPGALAGALSNYISPLGGITLPIIVLGGLYVASQVLIKR